ncbi:hypothetical protein [Butyrivibrio sp. VCD2006]|uniref:hypothetical protein n=1 Tax=Butyrivibrio sp. VCD2006 TaxID=1280664 RepID=UPI00047ED32B|nr:hypothetical protein [Butyrivibrio sp. VCD2006]
MGGMEYMRPRKWAKKLKEFCERGEKRGRNGVNGVDAAAERSRKASRIIRRKVKARPQWGEWSRCGRGKKQKSLRNFVKEVKSAAAKG